MTDDGQIDDTAENDRDAARDFALWALATLQFRVETNDDRVYTLFVPDDRPELFNGAGMVRFSFAANSTKGDPTRSAAQLLRPQSPMFKWLVGQLNTTGVLHAVPKQQAASVHHVSSKLFEHFQVDGGNVHLAGCTLEDRPMLRLTYATSKSKPDTIESTGDEAESSETEKIDEPELSHIVVTPDGTLVEPELVDTLHLHDLKPCTGRPPAISDAVLEEWLKKGDELCRQSNSQTLEHIAATISWCKYAEGKLAFSIGSESVETSFHGWAQLFRDGLLKPDPFVCPETGVKSYHLAATDDGRITAAEAIEPCGESGKRVLTSDLQTCEITGKRALPEFFQTCPISGKQVVRSALVECPMCHERVSSPELQGERCKACRTLKKVNKDDPRMARLLGEYAKLDRWRKWTIAETAAVYVLVTSSISKRLLLVVNKESLEVSHIASSGRIFGGWIEVPEGQREELLV